MNINELAEESSVDLEIFRGSEKSNITTTISVVKDTYILVPAITLQGKVVGFDNCLVNLIYIDNDKPLAFKAVKVTPVKYEGKVYHSVTALTPAETYNRRRAFRVYMGRTMYVTTFTSTGPQSTEVLVKDVSEAGYAFITKEYYAVGDNIRLQMALSDEQAIRLSSTVIRSEDKGGGEKIYGCEFGERNRLLGNFLMKYQSEKQKNKLEGTKRAGDDE